jgi:2-acylglycerol O-acyltransferase 2
MRLIGAVSFGGSLERRLQTLSVFTFSLYLLLPLLVWCWILMFGLLFNPATMPFALAYLLFIFWFDTSPVDGKRVPFLRGSGAQGNWWRRYCAYFPMTLVKTAELPAQHKYVLGYHPHGIISVGAFGCFATNGASTIDLTLGEKSPRDDRRGFSALFPAIHLRLCTLAFNFYVPFVREYILSLGCCNASRATFRKVLAQGAGHGLVIVPGGAAESMLVEPGSISLVLASRKGFVREAILAGAHLVPCLAFGEADLYDVQRPEEGSFMAWLQRGVYRCTGFGMPFFNGRSVFLTDVGLMPRRRPICVVVGAPLAPPAGWSSLSAHSPEMHAAVDALHGQYVRALHALYASHKDVAWNLPSLKRIGTFKVLK